MNYIDTKKVYSEVYEYINVLGEPYISKVPNYLIELLRKEKDNDYIINKPLNVKSLKKESISLIALINLNYWCDNELQKNRLISKYKENEIKQQQILKEKYDSNKIFENVHSQKVSIESGSKTEYMDIHPVAVKEGLFKRILTKIKKFIFNKF